MCCCGGDEEEDRLKCCAGCGEESCMSVAKHNCTHASVCCYCPIRHVCYGCSHCGLCCTKKANWDEDQIQKDRDLNVTDKCFGDHHFLAALCLPFTSLFCLLGVPGCTSVYVGSTFCCSAGLCCKLGTCIGSCACCAGGGACKCLSCAGEGACCAACCAGEGACSLACCAGEGACCSACCATGPSCCSCCCCCNPVVVQPI